MEPTQKRPSSQEPCPRYLLRQIFALLIPLMALVVQWNFWAAVQPFVWFLFYPAVFFSSWIGGLYGGLASTMLSAAIVWWFFIPLVPSTAMSKTFVSIIIFMGMGILFSLLQERLKRANRRTEEALETAHKANDELQSANQKITQLYEKTRELDDLKSQFFANVSHELRTPLALILGPVGKHLASGSMSEELRQDLEMIDRNARLLSRHVTDLLDVAKVEAGRMQMQYSRVDLARLMRFVASHFEVLSREKQIQFLVRTPDALPIWIDSDKCRRILFNLLSNAFKFSEDGGAIVLSTYLEGGQAVIEVMDNGPGVPVDMREAIFERFRQLDGGAERRYGGTGLGLAIVKEFVELHGGAIELKDAPGGGAVFRVGLPLEAPEGAVCVDTPETPDEALERQVAGELQARAPTKPQSTASPVAALVLVVEDNPDMNAYVAETLGRRHRIVTAFDGEEGLAKALSARPDLVVTDVMMPRLSGDQMVAAMRRHSELEDVPILVLTAKADEALRVDMLGKGAQDYLAKPFSDDELLARVDGLIAQQRKLRDVREGLSAIVESSEDAIIGRSLDGAITSWNQSAQRLFGYTEQEAIGQPLAMLCPASHAVEEREILERIERGERIEHFDTVRIARDGRPVDVSIAMSPIKDSLGRIVGGSTIARDISERKQAETLLRESQLRLDLAVHSAQMGIWSWDIDGDKGYFDEQVCRLLGINPLSFRGTSEELFAAVHPGDHEAVKAALQRTLSEEAPYDTQYRAVWPDGSVHHLCARGRLVRDASGRSGALNGVLWDVTAMKRAEEELRAGEERFRTIFEQAAVGVAQVDSRSGRFVRINKKFCEIVGYSQEEMLGLRFQDITHPDHVQPDAETAAHYPAGEVDTYTAEKRYIRKDGSTAWVTLTVSPMHAEGVDPTFHIGIVQDITERKKVEVALQQRTEELQRFFDVALDLLCIADASGYFRRLNQAWERTLGFTSEELMAAHFYEFVHPADVESTLDAASKLARQEDVINFVNRYRCRDGSYRWMEWRSTPVGELIYAAARDITNRIEAEEAIRGRESTLRGILDATKESIFQVGLDGRVLIANQTALNRLGRTAEEVVGRPTAQIFPEDLARSRSAYMRETVESGAPVEFEDEHGGILLHHTFYPIMDSEGTVTSVAVYSRDITEAKRATGELERALIKYRTLFECFPLGVTVTDQEGRILEANPEAVRLLGVSAGTILHRSIDGQEWDVVRSDGTPMPSDEFASVQALREQRLISGVEMGIVQSQGETTWISVNAAPVPLPDHGVVIAFNDIGARRRAEEELRASLEEKVALLKEVHHRVKNNLQIVASLLGLQADRSDNEHVVAALQETRNRVRSIALLHETLYRSGNLARLDFVSYLKDLIRHLAMAYSMASPRVKLEYHLAEVAFPLEQAVPCGLIVSELVSNALKHGFPEGHTGRIVVGLEPTEDRKLVLSVRDEGVGLPLDFNLDATPTLGLKLVSELAGQLRGQLVVEAQKGAGAAFRVIFPISQDIRFGGD